MSLRSFCEGVGDVERDGGAEVTPKSDIIVDVARGDVEERARSRSVR